MGSLDLGILGVPGERHAVADVCIMQSIPDHCTKVAAHEPALWPRQEDDVCVGNREDGEERDGSLPSRCPKRWSFFPDRVPAFGRQDSRRTVASVFSWRRLRHVMQDTFPAIKPGISQCTALPIMAGLLLN